MNGLNSFSTTNPCKIKHPTPLERAHRSSLIIYVDQKYGVYIAKNRYGPTGNIGTKDLINIVSHILARQSFKNTCNMFQEGMIEQSLNPAICKVLEEYKVLKGE